ncbi:MAG: ADP-heptose synthase, D-beta-D-heptose 7-phosphate kinase / D-beta-D-heptose 1-phosphate [Fibrobacteres bacterium]|nr:ADP-heptose synthase, D-beta-D-heptose 7-phosphate kinase / D-beta-D-heptose 1-phosphate [Fibrobacterota bacterium]
MDCVSVAFYNSVMDSTELLSRFASQTILVLGDVFLDEFLSGDCSRLSPEAPVPVLKVDDLKTRRVLGGAANTAANVASLGAKAVLIGIDGDDWHGTLFRDLVEKNGILYAPIRDGRPTMRKTRLVGQGQQLLRLDYEETPTVSDSKAEEILAMFRKHLPACGIVVLSDYAKGLFTEAMTQTIIKESHAAGKEVLVDPRPQHASYYTGCDYVTPNWKESQGLLGQTESDPTESLILENGAALRDALHTHVILTLGARGITFFDRDARTHFNLPTQAREVYDVSGAGDTVVATFALARAAGGGLEDSVRLANKAAGVVVGKFGTATVTREELLDAEPGEARMLSRSQLAPLAQSLKAQGKRIVTLNGSFDLLHAGHVHILDEARAQGDVLIVGLNSDASVRAYKGAHRPIIPEAQRATMLLAMRAVDFVHIFDETEPMPFLAEIKPQVHVNGSEYGPDCIEAPLVQANGGRIHIIEKIPGLSTSEILSRVRSLE